MTIESNALPGGILAKTRHIISGFQPSGLCPLYFTDR